MNSNTNEINLWEGLTKKDEATFKAVYTIYYASLYRYGRKITHDDNLVKDGIQDLFLSLYNRETPFNQQQPLKFFLLTALRNKLMDSFKKNTKDVFTDSFDEAIAGPDDSSLDQIIQIETQNEASRKMKLAMSQLSERQREALHLRYFEELSPQQIADIMQLNYQSVLNLIQRGLYRLSTVIRIVAIVSTTFLHCFIIPIPKCLLSRKN